MKILVEQFCTLATSPSWQSWLYHYNQELHERYVAKLREIAGCNASRDLMSVTLKEINQKGGSGQLSKFLRRYYPQMIKDDITDEQRKSDDESINQNQVFPSYTPGILTYPRRIIFVGPKIELMKQVREFLLDKLISDHIIIEDRAYVEYLEKSDMYLKDSIPMKSWRIAAYRNKHNI